MICRCCRSQNLDLVLDLGNQPWGNDFLPIDSTKECEKFPLQLFFCHDCSMAQIGYTIQKEHMFVNHTYLSGTTKSLREHFVGVGESILNRIDFSANDFILDIGGNDGTFLESFHNRKISVLNIDSGKLQSKASNDKGILCENCFFDKDTADRILKEHGQAKVIHGSGIFFHLEELHGVFEGIKTLLSSDGLLVAEFIYLPDMIKKCAYDQIYHEHLLYYSLISFQNLLDQFDLEIFDAEMKPIHGGSCIAYITHKNEKERSSALVNLIKKEIDEGFNSIDVFQRFAQAVSKSKVDLLKLICSIKKQGASIQALGAPVKGSTIINYCQLTTKEIDCGVEINPLKCNTYFPGTKIPVYHQDATPTPDVYLMLAWNFKDEILSKLTDFRDSGGKVLMPVPIPELV